MTDEENAELEEIRGHQARIINNDTDRIERFEEENEQLKNKINCPMVNKCRIVENIK